MVFIREKSIGYRTFREGFLACLPTVLGYFGIGFAAGVVGSNADLSLIEIGLMSLLIYAGSAQFIICGLLLVGSSLPTIVLTTFLVNARHLLMSLSAAQQFKEYTMLENIGLGTLLTDESYGVLMAAVASDKKVSLAWMNGLNITAYLCWFIATIIGALIGRWIPNPEALGLDYALIGMFIAIFVLQIDRYLKKSTRNILIVLGVVAFSLFILMTVLSESLAVLVATIIGCIVGVMLDGN